MNLALDIVSQLLEGALTQKRTNAIPDSQHMRLTQMSKRYPVGADQKHAHAFFLRNTKKRVSMLDN